MTNLMRFTPASDVRSVQREIDRVFDSFFPARSEGENGSGAQAVWAPRVDLSETEDAYQIHLDVPGLTKDDLNINVHDGQLTVSGERRRAQADEQRDFVRVERHHGSFYRSFRLPKQIDAGKIEAAYENGVLNLHVPKTAESKPRRIEVS